MAKNLLKPKGFYELFERRPGPDKKTTTYCPGCGHGIFHKLIAEAIGDFGVQDNAIFISSIGCSVFAYYYMDMGNIAASHGRAPAVASAVSRARPESVLITYQGDGDLGAIGFNNMIQAANRGECITVFFVNNAVYSMTGGQMAPTTLLGQVTTTTPYGRRFENEGLPLRICEMVATLEAPVYVERVALTDTRHILAARRAVRKAIRNGIEHRGFSLVEALSPCPTNWKVKPTETQAWIEQNQIPYFPLKCFKDIAAERDPIRRPHPIHDPDEIRKVLGITEEAELTSGPIEDGSFAEYRCRLAGFGGQGVLSLGLMIARAGQEEGRFVTWLPSYGPEMRGGTASSSVVLSGQPIGPPLVSAMDFLVAMNQPSMERFISQVCPGGLVLYDTMIAHPVLRDDIRCLGVPATEMANQVGDSRTANTVMLGVYTAIDGHVSKEAALRAVETILIDKQETLPANRRAFELGYQFGRTHE